MDAPFIRDEEQEDIVQKMIYENARGPEPDGDDDDFSSQFLNDSGEGLESEERRDDEVPLTNFDGDDEVPLTNSGEVYLYIKAVLISRCIDLFVLHLLTNHFSFSLLDHRANLLKSKVLEARRNLYRARLGYPSPHLRLLANRWNPKRTSVNL
jgi:hypothetical protein